MSNFLIRDVTLEDAERLCEIYSYYVKNTAVSFEYEAPSVEEFKKRILLIKENYPYICLIEDNKILGYAYAFKFHPREAFKYCVELSIYLDKDSCKKGAGKKLYKELENRLLKKGIRNLYACIAVPEIPDEYLDFNSRDFHEHSGFKTIGYFSKCGRKFDRWYNMIWMEKIIASYND